MGFNLPHSGTEIKFISEYDGAIDWKATTEQHGFTRDDFSGNIAKRAERQDLLVFHDGQQPVYFHLEIPRGSVVNRLTREGAPIETVQKVAMAHIKKAENLERDGKPVQIEHKKDGVLEARCQDAIPPLVILEIGNFLLDRGNGLDSPLSS